MELSQKQKVNLNSQIKETYFTAFFDLLEAKVKQQPPDYEWIVNLYKEIRHKLTFFLKKGSAFRKHIEEGMDIELFDQMLRNNAIGGVEFYNLVNFVFECTLKLGSAGRDKDVEKKRDEIFDCMKNGGLFCQLVPLFIKNANTCIDWIHEDLGNVKKNLSKIEKKQ
jgi:hypothetical protein